LELGEKLEYLATLTTGHRLEVETGQPLPLGVHVLIHVVEHLRFRRLPHESQRAMMVYRSSREDMKGKASESLRRQARPHPGGRWGRAVAVFTVSSGR
jgi:hypothetical protein